MHRVNHIQVSKHYWLYEFADHNDNELVVLHPLFIVKLELVHERLEKFYKTKVSGRVTSGTRTKRSNTILGQTLGWISEGGVVSAKSKHQPHFGGIAGDLVFYPRASQQPFPSTEIATIARKVFDYVKLYADGHCHFDIRRSIEWIGPQLAA